MANLQKLISRWTGFPGAPGYTVNYFDPASTTSAADMRAFWEAIKALLPSNVTITVDGGGDLIEETTGALTGGWVEAAPAPVIGTSIAVYAAPAGAEVQWNTLGIVHNRRLRGRTFIVPLASGGYATDGTLDTPDIATIQAAANALVGSATSGLQVWSRPFAGTPTNPARLGNGWDVTSATVKDKVVILRSRRD